jgi:hypothetical protein
LQKTGVAQRIYSWLESFIMDKLVVQDGPGPFFKWYFKLPIVQYKPGMGWMIGKRVLLLTTTGRKSGRPRRGQGGVVQPSSRCAWMSRQSTPGRQSDYPDNFPGAGKLILNNHGKPICPSILSTSSTAPVA